MILAHGAGIDDAAFVVLPVLVIVVVRWLNRRGLHQDERRNNRRVTRNDAASS